MSRLSNNRSNRRHIPQELEEGDDGNSRTSFFQDKIGRSVPQFCKCRELIPTEMRTSWTILNPGRRFMTCERNVHVMGGKKCKFFWWVDASLCERGREVMPGIMLRLKTKDADEMEYKRRIKNLWIALFVSWIFFCLYLFKN